MASTSYLDPRIAQISPIYKIFLLYIEPIFAFGGAYLSLFDPAKFLLSTAPASLSAQTSSTIISSPVTSFLTADIAAVYLLFGINEAVTLRLTRDYSVWKSVVFAMLISDFGHLFAIWRADPAGCFEAMSWSTEEWINYSILIFGVFLRAAFLLGIGNGNRR